MFLVNIQHIPFHRNHRIPLVRHLNHIQLLFQSPIQGCHIFWTREYRDLYNPRSVWFTYKGVEFSSRSKNSIFIVHGRTVVAGRWQIVIRAIFSYLQSHNSTIRSWRKSPYISCSVHPLVSSHFSFSNSHIMPIVFRCTAVQ